jgi:hypothetical protein
MRVLHFKIAFFLVAVLLCSCHQPSNQNNSNSIRDTLLTSFFKMIDTLPYYDTTNLNFKLLKAFKENDTSNLEEITDYIHRTSTTPWMHDYLKPCAVNMEFDTLTADEAYKFSYESSFCEYYTIATITQRGNKVKVNVTVYKNASKLDLIPCTIAQQYETEIDSTSWTKFQEVIFAVDFWGLKEDNEYHGNDGSSLDVQGYQKYFKGNRNIQPRRSYVSRWSRSMDNLLGPFLMLLRFCKIDKGCIGPN